MGSRKMLSKQKRYFFIEKFIIIIVMFVSILLIGSNVIRVYDHYITAQFSEFNTADLKNNVPSQGIMEVVIEDDKMYPMLEVIVNGELSGHRFNENNRITITVHDGDVIQINSCMYSDDIKIGIKGMSPNVGNVLGDSHMILKEGINTLAIIRI
ncbi:MAG: hypothetical protein ACOX0L_03235 [Natronincolaceae bacterium]|jgi:hypothetical protein|nr:hypothetical protein [Bacillota bacterium]NLK90823.1 hypothetical protein [Clostridiales bacterium]